MTGKRRADDATDASAPVEGPPSKVQRIDDEAVRVAEGAFRPKTAHCLPNDRSEVVVKQEVKNEETTDAPDLATDGDRSKELSDDRRETARNATVIVKQEFEEVPVKQEVRDEEANVPEATSLPSNTAGNRVEDGVHDGREPADFSTTSRPEASVKQEVRDEETHVAEATSIRSDPNGNQVESGVSGQPESVPLSTVSRPEIFVKQEVADEEVNVPEVTSMRSDTAGNLVEDGPETAVCSTATRPEVFVKQEVTDEEVNVSVVTSIRSNTSGNQFHGGVHDGPETADFSTVTRPEVFVKQEVRGEETHVPEATSILSGTAGNRVEDDVHDGPETTDFSTVTRPEVFVKQEVGDEETHVPEAINTLSDIVGDQLDGGDCEQSETVYFSTVTGQEVPVKQETADEEANVLVDCHRPPDTARKPVDDRQETAPCPPVIRSELFVNRQGYVQEREAAPEVAVKLEDDEYELVDEEDGEGKPFEFEPALLGVHTAPAAAEVQRQLEECKRKYPQQFRNFSDQIWAHHEEYKQTEDVFGMKTELGMRLLRAAQKMFAGVHDVTIHITGSTVNGFGSRESDMDLVLLVTPPGQPFKTEQLNTNHGYCKKILYRIWHHFRYQCSGSQVIPAKKAPVLHMEMTLKRAGSFRVEMDVGVNKLDAIYNSHLLQCYSSVDPRLPALVLLVKRWAKKMEINDGQQQTFNSISLTLMVLHFLQCGVQPAVLPSLQFLFPEKFPDNPDVTRLSTLQEHELPARPQNTQSIGELLVGFFIYFHKFDFKRHYISIRDGKCGDRRDLPPSENAKYLVWIEEPFNRTNTARCVQGEKSLEKIRAAFEEAADMLTRIGPHLMNIQMME